jgi:hypothetical protein
MRGDTPHRQLFTHAPPLACREKGGR